jgi:hypothetical protein
MNAKINKVKEVIPLMLKRGLIKSVGERQGYSFIVTYEEYDHANDRKVDRTGSMVPGWDSSALWLINRFTMYVTIDGNLDSFEFIGPTRWTVKLSLFERYGSGIGRSFGEAVFRAMWHMLAVDRPDEFASCRATDEDMLAI